MIDPRKHIVDSTKTLGEINNPWIRNFEEMKGKTRKYLNSARLQPCVRIVIQLIRPLIARLFVN